LSKNDNTAANATGNLSTRAARNTSGQIGDNAHTIVFCIEALTVGGAEQMLVAMANQFVLRGWSVHMICLTKAGELAQMLDSQVNVHVMNKKSGVDFRLARRVRALVKGIQPTAVNSHLWTANLWARIALFGTSIPIIVTEHSRDTWKAVHYRFIDRVLSRRTNKLVAVSNDTADFYLSEIKLTSSLVTVINNGVDTKRYAAGDGATLKKQWAPGNELLLGTVGRMVPAKNHVRLLNMAVLLKEQQTSFKLVLVGDGELRSDIEQAIQEKSLQNEVILAGARSDIPDVLSALDIFILSSDREGHPLTALEAQAAGTPVILTNAGGSADALAVNETSSGGMLVDKDAQALAQAVLSMSQHPQSLQQMGAFAQAHALERFDMQHMVDQYEQLFLGD